MPLQRETRRHRGQCVVAGEILDVERLDRGELVDHLSHRFVVAELQVRVGEIVGGVKVIEGDRSRMRLRGVVARSLRRFEVGVDRLLPHAEADENVRRHVESVRG